MKRTFIGVLLSTLILIVSCTMAGRDSKSDQQQSEAFTSQSFEELLKNTMRKVEMSGKKEMPEFLPEEKAAMLCFFYAEKLCGAPGELFPGKDGSRSISTLYCPSAYGNTKDVYLNMDMQSLDEDLIGKILDAEFDVLSVIQKVCREYPIDRWRGLSIKQKNIVIAAQIIDLAGVKSYNEKLLSVWKDTTENEMIRDFCLEIVLENCDEQSYLYIRDLLLDERGVTAYGKAKILALASRVGNCFAIPLAIFVSENFDGIFVGYDRTVTDRTLKSCINRTLKDFDEVIRRDGANPVLLWWLYNRDYIYRDMESSNAWAIDVARKYRDVGITTNPLNRKVAVMAMSRLRKSNEKILFDRMGLTEKQFSEIPVGKLIIWDRISKSEKEKLIIEANKTPRQRAIEEYKRYRQSAPPK